jgi:monoamine oxidase
VFTNSGKCFTAKYCVSSIPILQCLKIEFNPPLPTERVKILQQMEMGKVVKVLVSYSSPFWRKKSLSGETMSDAFPLSFTFEYNSEGTLVCYITSHAVEFSKLSVEVNLFQGDSY